MQNTKTLIQSWTFWFGAAQILSGIFGYLSNSMDQNAALTLIGTGIGTITLRLKTTTQISGIK